MAYRLTAPQNSLLNRVLESEKGWIAIRGRETVPARNLQRKLRFIYVGTRNPNTGEPCPAYSGNWTWTLERII